MLAARPITVLSTSYNPSTYSGWRGQRMELSNRRTQTHGDHPFQTIALTVCWGVSEYRLAEHLVLGGWLT